MKDMLEVEDCKIIKRLIKLEILKRLDFVNDIVLYQIVSYYYPPTEYQEAQLSIGIGYQTRGNDIKEHHRLELPYNKNTHHIFIDKINEVIDRIYEVEKQLKEEKQ